MPANGVKRREKVLVIGNYPPPMCGWAIQTMHVVEEIRKRGHICQVLKINENRKIKDAAYVDVQNGADYLRKVFSYGIRGYRINVSVNGQSKKGYLLALAALLIARFTFQPGLLTFHGGLFQQYFPRPDSRKLRWAFGLLFHVASQIACNSDVVKDAIAAYGIAASKITPIPTFSMRYLDFAPQELGTEVEKFLAEHSPVFFSYVSFRPEYRLDVLRRAMGEFRMRFPQAGFVWVGFPGKELAAAEEYVKNWTKAEQESLLLLGNLDHDRFLSLLSRATASIRTPACDGVCASVLESLALGIPVIASQNGSRPAGVITYQETDARELYARMIDAVENRHALRVSLATSEPDNITGMADWIVTGAVSTREEEMAHAL